MEMKKQPFELKYVAAEASIVLPGCELIAKGDNFFLFKYESDEVLVFDDYDSAQNFVDSTLADYFNHNHQQLVPIYETLSDSNNWRQYVNWGKVGKWIKNNYDEMVGNQFSGKNKKAVLDEILQDVEGYVNQICENRGVKSEFLFDFFKHNEINDEIADMMEFRVYEHGSYFYVPKVILP